MSMNSLLWFLVTLAGMANGWSLAEDRTETEVGPALDPYG